jgi:hypothetical protein
VRSLNSTSIFYHKDNITNKANNFTVFAVALTIRKKLYLHIGTQRLSIDAYQARERLKTARQAHNARDVSLDSIDDEKWHTARDFCLTRA